MGHRIDGSKNEWGWSKSKVGANAILAVSMAVCRAGAAASGMPLYQYIVPWLLVGGVQGWFQRWQCMVAQPIIRLEGHVSCMALETKILSLIVYANVLVPKSSPLSSPVVLTIGM